MDKLLPILFLGGDVQKNTVNQNTIGLDATQDVFGTLVSRDVETFAICSHTTDAPDGFMRTFRIRSIPIHAANRCSDELHRFALYAAEFFGAQVTVITARQPHARTAGAGTRYAVRTAGTAAAWPAEGRRVKLMTPDLIATLGCAQCMIMSFLMARRSVPPPKPRPPILTVGQKRRRIERLQKCIQGLEAFDPQKVQRRLGVPEVLALEEAIDKALSSAFGYGTPAYIRYNLAATLDHGPLTTTAALAGTVVPPVGGPRRREAQAQEARQYFSEGKERSIALLREAICTLEREIANAQPVAQAAQKSKGVADADHSPPGAQVAEATQKAAEVRTLQPRQRRGIDLKAAWRRVGRWWRGRN